MSLRKKSHYRSQEENDNPFLKAMWQLWAPKLSSIYNWYHALCSWAQLAPLPGWAPIAIVLSVMLISLFINSTLPIFTKKAW